MEDADGAKQLKSFSKCLHCHRRFRTSRAGSYRYCSKLCENMAVELAKKKQSVQYGSLFACKVTHVVFDSCQIVGDD